MKCDERGTRKAAGSQVISVPGMLAGASATVKKAGVLCVPPLNSLLKNAVLAFFNLAKCEAKLLTAAQNNDLRRNSVIASMRCSSLLSASTGCYVLLPVAFSSAIQRNCCSIQSAMRWLLGIISRITSARPKPKPSEIGLPSNK